MISCFSRCMFKLKKFSRICVEFLIIIPFIKNFGFHEMYPKLFMKLASTENVSIHYRFKETVVICRCNMERLPSHILNTCRAITLSQRNDLNKHNQIILENHFAFPSFALPQKPLSVNES